MYDKKIAYLHFIKNNELVGNAGHAKVMYRGNSMSLEVYVRDVPMLSGSYYSLTGLGEGGFEDKIHIERGQAVYKRRFPVDKTKENQVPYGIKIELGENEYLEAVWQVGRQPKADVKSAEKVLNNPAENKIGEKEWEKEDAIEEVTVKEQHESRMEKVSKTETIREDKPREQFVGRIGGNQLTFSVPVETYEDKWKELCKQYDVVHPFGNGETYISISPKDFIIFPEKYQNLVNNSFLLHGYYNYRHVILGRKEEGSKPVYYLGVPGVYYEREKMVAIMFGFEGFECGDKKANNGGFGYYMRRVEL